MNKRFLKAIISRSEAYNWGVIQYFDVERIKKQTGEGWSIGFTYKGGDNYAIHYAHIELADDLNSFSLFIHDGDGSIGLHFMRHILGLMEELKNYAKQQQKTSK